jgi:hypothetical protein
MYLEPFMHRTTEPNRFAPRSARGSFRFARALALAAVASLALAACHDDDDDDFHHIGHDAGGVVLDNRTDSTTDEDVMEFRLAPDGEALGPNRLPTPLPPGDADYLGDFEEDLYDAEAIMELGDVVEWFDVFIGDGDVTTFEVF